ncbi:hypothetical protein E2C01_090830 [Portunus trituberculatus]|uniref:Uncharacterized protein n=1 Tax=Portunus trituberculatus TaxID=210409 RepID=A0A5B7JHN3_PORTR|nr:hypothetical protein [Portunus trituberculatus]
MYLAFILPKTHVCLPSIIYSTAADGKRAKKTCRVILGPAYTNYHNALTTLSLPNLSTTSRGPGESCKKTAASPRPTPLAPQ